MLCMKLSPGWILSASFQLLLFFPSFFFLFFFLTGQNSATFSRRSTGLSFLQRSRRDHAGFVVHYFTEEVDIASPFLAALLQLVIMSGVLFTEGPITTHFFRATASPDFRFSIALS